jgi:hypothetical protein
LQSIPDSDRAFGGGAGGDRMNFQLADLRNEIRASNFLQESSANEATR